MTTLRTRTSAPAASPSSSPVTRLRTLLAGGAGPAVRDIVIELPSGPTPAKLRLLTGAEEEEVALAVAAWLLQVEAETGISASLIAATGQMSTQARNYQEALSRAVRDAEDESKQFGTVEDWRGLDERTVGEVVRLYQDLVEELDPLKRPMTKEELAEVGAFVEKKDWSLLPSIGWRKLIGWRRTTADLPADSPTARS